MKMLKLNSKFESYFNAPPHGSVLSPGRACMLGEHCDYNNGFVLPFALDLATTATFKTNENSVVRVRSLQYPDYVDEFDVGREIQTCDVPWANYVRGIFITIRNAGYSYSKGLDLQISSTIPPDVGLASSAAMATAVAGAIVKALNLAIDKRSLALIVEKAENEFLGKQCGIMDPLTCTRGQEGHLLLVDCRDYSVKNIPFPYSHDMVIFNTGLKNKLLAKEFNNLRNACNRAAAAMSLGSLRQATIEKLKTAQSDMDSEAYRRAYHIVTENDRTQRVAKALIDGKINHVLDLMNESHKSLNQYFENTIPEIDGLVYFCQETLNGRVGARMTGGGFGGSVIALCHKDEVDLLTKIVARKYKEQFDSKLLVHVCKPAGGMMVQMQASA